MQGALRGAARSTQGALREQEPSGCGGGGTGQFKRWCWSNWMSTGEGMNLDLNLVPYKETNSKWIMDLNANVNSKTYRRAQEKIFGKDFLDKSTANI